MYIELPDDTSLSAASRMLAEIGREPDPVQTRNGVISTRERRSASGLCDNDGCSLRASFIIRGRSLCGPCAVKSKPLLEVTAA